ncbi:MAG: hypothetical protein ABIR15_18085 [Chitinophagaceae bacterium]
MNIINNIKKGCITVITLLVLFTSCNKLNVDPVPVTVPTTPAGNTVAKVLAATPTDSLYYRLVIKSGILSATPATITDSSLRFTMFVPDNNAMKAFINAISGGAVPLNAPDAVFSGFITANIPVSSALPIVSYNIVPQALPTTSFPTAFPNLQYPTIFNPAPALSALLRLTTFPSKRGSITWVNNVPLSSADAVATNGIIHHTAAVVVPPSQYLWDRINTDPDMTYFKAAVQRADSGTGTLQAAMLNIGANLTVFVPTDSAMKAAITAQLTVALIAQGYAPATAAAAAAGLAATPDVFTNPAVAGSLTPTVVKGIVAYHILGIRVFTVNFPTTTTVVPTLIGGAPYPGVGLLATLAGPIAAAASVKGAGAYNTTPSNILLNPTPGTGKSDQLYLNGVIHKIDQALFPQ